MTLLDRGARTRRGAGRRLRLLGVLFVLALSTSCATKRDLKDLRGEVAALRAQQDSLFRLLESNQRRLLSSTEQNRDAITQARGDLIRQLLQMEEQLFQIQELTGQSQRRLQELRQQFEQRSTELTEPLEATSSRAAPQPTPSGGDPEELYALGREQLEQGNVRTARQAFEGLLSSAPEHRLAPDAQFSLAESYVGEDVDRALREFERVQEMFPNSPRAPAALFRAGVVAGERGDVPRARGYFQRVVRGYPSSNEAAAASEALSQLGT